MSRNSTFYQKKYFSELNELKKMSFQSIGVKVLYNGMAKNFFLTYGAIQVQVISLFTGVMSLINPQPQIIKPQIVRAAFIAKPKDSITIFIYRNLH